MTVRKTTKQFICDSKKVHDNKYDYSLVKYINNKTKIRIICPVHGMFEQKPSHHLLGSGCKRCTRTGKLTTKTFIEKAKKVHNDKYDYSLVEYIGYYDCVNIICSLHGVFKQTPSNHLHVNKYGCKFCAGNEPLTTELFIEKAKKVHHNKYDYSLVKYVNNKTKIKIICKKHGTFLQEPASHLSKNGCFKCIDVKKTSKNQLDLYEKIKTICDKEKIEIEYPIKQYKVDICFVNKKIIVEYYGDYWHCNPKKYKSDYWNKKTKMYAKDIWLKDEKRMQDLKKLGYKTIIIWENDYKNNKEDVIEVILENIKEENNGK